MDSFEVFVGFLALVSGALTWFKWYAAVLSAGIPRSSLWNRIFLASIPPANAMLLGAILWSWASADVRGSGLYLAYYLLFGIGWLGGMTQVFALLGLSVRDDAVARRNLAAAPAMGGGLLGVTLCFAGANVGNGPGVEVVLLSALASTVPFLLCWLAAEFLSERSLAERVSVERNKGTGWRLAGFLAGVGVVLGRAVAGDWVSTYELGESLVRIGWAVVPLLLLFVVVERRFRAPSASASGVLAFLYLAGSLAYIWIWHRQL